MKPIDDKHITIQGWMRTALNLKGEKLQAFALVWGFCQDGESMFYGSLKYVMEWLGCSKPTAIASLDFLTNAGLIVKHPGRQGVESNRYTINTKVVELLRAERAKVVKELNQGGKESLPVGVKNFNQGGKESLPDIDNNKDTGKDRENPPAQFLVTTVAVETIPTANEYTASAPNWMDVAKEMAAYAEGEGKGTWEFMCDAQGYTGKPLPICSNWASKASPYQLKNWKTEFRKLQTWLKTEARADAAPAIKRAMQQNNFNSSAPLKTFTEL